MADLLSNLHEWMVRNAYAPQSNTVQPQESNQYFQYRQTGVPGVITNSLPQGILGRQVDENPAEYLNYNSLTNGPKTDFDTVQALRSLKSMWESRAAQKPNEGMIMINRSSQNNPGVYAHEAAHSLYQQGVTNPTHMDLLNELSGQMGVRPKGSTAGTEGVAYETGQPMYNISPRDRSFFDTVMTTMKQEGHSDIAGQLGKLHNRMLNKETPTPSQGGPNKLKGGGY